MRLACALVLLAACGAKPRAPAMALPGEAHGLRAWQRPIAVEDGPGRLVVVELPANARRRPPLGGSGVLTIASDGPRIVHRTGLSLSAWADLLARPVAEGGLGVDTALNLDGGYSTSAAIHIGSFDLEVLAHDATINALRSSAP